MTENNSISFDDSTLQKWEDGNKITAEHLNLMIDYTTFISDDIKGILGQREVGDTDTVFTKFSSLSGTVSGINSQVSTNTNNITALRNNVAGEISGINTKIGTQPSGNQDSIFTRLAGIDSSISSINTSVSTAEGNIQSNTSRISSLEWYDNTARTAIATLQTTSATKNDLLSYTTTANLESQILSYTTVLHIIECMRNSINSNYDIKKVLNDTLITYTKPVTGNLFNPATVTYGKLNNQGTAISPKNNSTTWTSDFIPVESGESYSCRNWNGEAFGTGVYWKKYCLYSDNDMNSAIAAYDAANDPDILIDNDNAHYIKISVPEGRLNSIVFMKKNKFSEPYSDTYTATYNSNLITTSTIDNAIVELLAFDSQSYTKATIDALFTNYVSLDVLTQTLNNYATNTALHKLLCDIVPTTAVQVRTLNEFTSAIATSGNNIEILNDITLTSDITITHNVNIYGGDHVINCDSHIISIENCNVKMYNLVVSHGGEAVIRVGYEGTRNDEPIIAEGNLFAKDCKFSDGKWVIQLMGRGIGTFINCDISLAGGGYTKTDKSYDGIGVHGNSKLYVYNCKIHDTYDEGISIHDFSYGEIYDTEVYNCGYQVSRNSGSALTDRKGAASSYGGIHIGGTGMGIVKNCYSHDNATYGIGLYCLNPPGSSGKTICIGNIVKNNGYVDGIASASDQSGGIIIYGVQDLELRNNTVIGNANYGIRFGVDTSANAYIAHPKSYGFFAENLIFDENGNQQEEKIDANANGGLHGGTIINALEDKADIDKTYPDLTAGQLTSTTGTTDSTPYINRINNNDSTNVDIQKIIGGTIKFNQMIDNGDFSEGNIKWGYARATGNVVDGICTISPTSAGISDGYVQIYKTLSRTANHVYFVRLSIMLSSTNYSSVTFNNTSSNNLITYIPQLENPAANVWYDLSNIYKSSDTAAEGTFAIRAHGEIALEDSFSIKSVMIFDLTEMFGESVADYIYALKQPNSIIDVDFVKTLFPLKYYPYNTGELYSVQTKGRRATKFNLWDEEWSRGTINKNDGTNNSQNNAIYGKNYIKVIAGQQYYSTCSIATNFLTRWYDSNYNYIGSTPQISANNTFTAPENAAYLRIAFNTSYGTIYKHDVCINIFDPEKNGTYEPYTTYLYPMDSNLTLRGKPIISNDKFTYNGDIYNFDGTVTRKYGIRDFQASDLQDETVVTDGVHTVYPLSSITEELHEPYQKVQNSGIIEEFIDNRLITVPVGNQSFYKTNLRNEIEHTITSLEEYNNRLNAIEEYGRSAGYIKFPVNNIYDRDGNVTAGGVSSSFDGEVVTLTMEEGTSCSGSIYIIPSWKIDDLVGHGYVLFIDITNEHPDNTYWKLNYMRLSNSRYNWTSAINLNGLGLDIYASHSSCQIDIDRDFAEYDLSIYPYLLIAPQIGANENMPANTLTIRVRAKRKDKDYVYADKLVDFNQNNFYTKTEINTLILQPDYKIVFWGDSLTAGAGGEGTNYPNVCASELGIATTNILNCGVGGESANTIAARQGGNTLIIPAGAINGDYTPEQFVDIFGGSPRPLRQGTGNNTGNTLYVDGQECTLSRTQTSSTSSDLVYTISGYTGSTSAIPKLARFAGSNVNGEIVVIWVGQNGAHVGSDSSVSARIAIIDSMIAHIGHMRYVIFGLSSGTETERADEDAALLAHYGNKFFPVRKMLVNYGLTIAGITSTAQDATDIASGKVPTSLRLDVDNVHMNSYGYTAIGKLLADKIRSLGYV